MQKTLQHVFLLLVVFLFSATYIYADDLEKPEPPKKEELKKKQAKKDEETIPKKKKQEQDIGLRLQAVAEQAKEYGFQKGFGERYAHIQKTMEGRQRDLDMMYPFEQVLLQNGTVRPPVITKADDYANIPNPETLVRTGTAYRIIRNAEFVTVPPSWRTYIILPDDALTPQEPVKELLPRNSKEKKAWAEAYRKAFQEGMEAADAYFEEEMARLNREFKGMIEYHILNRQGKISLPGISQGHYDVRISDDTMEIDQRTFVIEDRPRFQKKDKWRK